VWQAATKPCRLDHHPARSGRVRADRSSTDPQSTWLDGTAMLHSGLSIVAIYYRYAFASELSKLADHGDAQCDNRWR